MSEDYVILPLKEEDARKFQSTHGAYAGDNIKTVRPIPFPEQSYNTMTPWNEARTKPTHIISLKQARFLRKCRQFLRMAFDD